MSQGGRSLALAVTGRHDIAPWRSESMSRMLSAPPPLARGRHGLVIGHWLRPGRRSRAPSMDPRIRPYTTIARHRPGHGGPGHPCRDRHPAQGRTSTQAPPPGAARPAAARPPGNDLTEPRRRVSQARSAHQ